MKRGSKPDRHQTPWEPKEKFVAKRQPAPIRPLNDVQDDYLRALRSEPQIIVLGPAGTGKSFLAGSHAADQLRTNKISKIVITRPNVPAGRSLGFFPGTLEEKIAPWVVPLMEVIKGRIGHVETELYVKNHAIEIVPFEVMRGRTFKNCIVILDEAQNTTVPEIKMFLTRIGDDCQVIINGDISQSDLKESSGLAKVMHLAKHKMNIPVIEFTVDDIVRSGICAEWVKAFVAAGL